MRIGSRTNGLVLDSVAHAYAYPSPEHLVGADDPKDIVLGIDGVGHYRICLETVHTLPSIRVELPVFREIARCAHEWIEVVWRRRGRTRSRWAPCVVPNMRLPADLPCATMLVLRQLEGA